MATFFQVKSFISYWLDAVDKHSLHSPFFFDLYTTVIRAKSESNQFDSFEDLRKQLLADPKIIPRNSQGAESHSIKDNNASISAIARTSLSPHKFLLLYHRLINHFRASNIIELGTSLGISTLYLAQPANVRVTTFEGSKEIAEVAKLTFQLAHAKNIKLIEGNLDTTLQQELVSYGKVDIAFIDANHRCEPTIRYFNQILGKTHNRSVIILDDIHHSAEMEKAWNEIRNNKLVYASIDLFRCGLIFFDPSVNKQHVVLQF